MKPTGYSVIYINDEPHVAIHQDGENEWPVLTMENAEKVMRWLAEVIDKVKGDQQTRKLREYLEHAKKQVDAMPEWKRNLLGIIVNRKPEPEDRDGDRYSYWPGGD